MSQSSRERLRQAQAAAARQKRLTRIIGIAAAVIVLVVVTIVIVVVVQSQTGGSTSNSVKPPNATSDGKAIAISPGKAKQDAPLVELFFDYQCPGCKQTDLVYGPKLRELAESGAITLHYRNLTFLDQSLMNDSSIRAGIGAACADTVGAYSAYHDGVFVNQPEHEGQGYTDAQLRETVPAAAGITGENLTAFRTCYDSKATQAFVNGTNELGQQDVFAIDKQLSTPTIHVNEKSFPLDALAGATTTEQVLEAIKKHA